MTKYLTTVEEIQKNIGKRIRFDDNYDYCNYGIGIIISFKDDFVEINFLNYGRPHTVWINTYRRIDQLKIELIEEDNTIINLEIDKKALDVIYSKDNNINHPSHYQGKIECIDYLQDKLTTEEFKGFLKGNVLKYLSRAGKKDDELQDLKKARWYLEKLIITMEK